ncbi:hypothetical protein [Desulfosporosinus sp. FKA]|uniref:hypothetical protein n=1 Tax=Desulfosporosinus sp. FKA TaxID=1969834 RepID=UPI000B49C21D|nr:hypothetical protein [Desulfosporosinus sp. FKA]
MDDIIWFPVTNYEKQRIRRICDLTGMTQQEWFEEALKKSERDLVSLTAEKKVVLYGTVLGKKLELKLS